MPSLNQFRKVRNVLVGVRRSWLAWTVGVEFHPSVSVSMSATFVGGEPGCITVGERTLIAFKTLLIARWPSGSVSPIRIGRHCFIGGGVTILPGVTIGDESIIAAGAVVTSSIPPGCIAGGNPARILRAGIEVLPYGRFKDVEQYRQRLGSAQ